MALNSLICADVPLRSCSLTHCYIQWLSDKCGSEIDFTFTSRVWSLQALACLNQWNRWRKKTWLQDVEKWASWFSTTGTVMILHYLSAVLTFSHMISSPVGRYGSQVTCRQLRFVRLYIFADHRMYINNQLTPNFTQRSASKTKVTPFKLFINCLPIAIKVATEMFMR